MEKKKEGQELKKSKTKESKEKLGDIRNQGKLVPIIFVVMMIVELGSIIYYFQFQKQGWHSDEIWSYGYANSYYQKDIFIDKDGNLLNYGEWVDSKALRDYLVVNKGEEFSYDSVYQNQITDLSPPLHSMLLHTICSFFPEKFSLWYSFTINIAAFLVCMIYLFKTTKLLKGEWFALCCCAVYGFSLGARDTYIYLRMYAMCTALVMIILYNLLVYIKADGPKTLNKNLAAISIAAFVGFLTHYYMIAFVGFLTFFVCVYYLFQKKLKRMLVFGGCQLIILLLSVAVFPSLLRVVQSNNTAVANDTKELLNFNFELRFRLLLNFITLKLFGASVPLFASGSLGRIFICGLGIFIWLLPVMYLFRYTLFVKYILRRLKFLTDKSGMIIRWLLRRINWYYIILAAVIPCMIITVGETSKVYLMGDYEDRYFMYIYPIAVIVMMALCYQIVVILFKKQKIGRVVVVVTSILIVGINIHNCSNYGEYLFRTCTEGQKLESNVADENCIYIERSGWLLTAMSPVLMKANRFFMCSPDDYMYHAEEYREGCEQERLILIIDRSFVRDALSTDESAGIIVTEEDKDAIESQKKYDEMIEFFEGLAPDSKMEWMGTEYVFTRPMEVYLVNP